MCAARRVVAADAGTGAPPSRRPGRLDRRGSDRAGGIGAVSATAPAEAILGAFGWRALFGLTCGLSVAVAAIFATSLEGVLLPGLAFAWFAEHIRARRAEGKRIGSTRPIRTLPTK